MLDIGSKHNFLEDLKGKAKQDLTNEILEDSSKYLKGTQIMELNKTLNHCFANYEIFVDQRVDTDENYIEKNKEILNSYIATKKLEGLSPRTLYAYRHNLKKLFIYLNKPIPNITTEDIRDYLQYYQSLNNCSNTVLDSLRR